MGASSGMCDQDDDDYDPSFKTVQIDAREILDTFPLPHLIVDPASRLHSINAAARHALGLPPVPKGGATPRIRADSVFWTTSEMPGSTASERLLGELFRLSKVEASWGSADAIELKSITVPGLRWAAEIKVRAFTTPKGVDDASFGSRSAPDTLGQTSSTWFSVVFLRPLPSRSDARDGATSKSAPSLPRPAGSLVEGRRKGSSSDRTPTLFATERMGDPFAWAMDQSVESTGFGESKVMVVDSEGPPLEPTWTHTVHNATSTAPSASDESPSTGLGFSVSSTAKATPTSPASSSARPNMRMHLSALPAPGTPPLSSAGTGSSKISSHASLLTNAGATSSPATSAQSAKPPSMVGSESSPGFAPSNSRTAEPIPEATEADALPGPKAPTPAQLFAAKAVMGVTVSSAGMHLSSSFDGPSTAASTIPISTPATLSPLLGKVPGDPTVPSSPRPTALPPPAPKPHVTPPEPSFLLKFAALSSLPKTGVIIADSDLASGFVNSIARELLMGVPADAATASQRQPNPVPPAGENSSSTGASGGSAPIASDSEHLNDWWSAGAWSSEDGWSAFSSSTSSSSFFPPQPQSMFADPESPFDFQGSRDLTHASIIASGEARPTAPNEGTAGSSIRIGKAHESNRYRATVAAILARSLASDEKRRARASPRSQKVHTHAGKDPKDRWATVGDHDSAAFVAAGSKQGKKPYKVFDHSFSQRIIDPFEPLLEICARRGEYPTPYAEDEDGDDDGGATSGMIVGIEVEVWESAEELKNGSFVTSHSASRKKRVRRRLVEISAAPIFAPSTKSKTGGKQHLGGVLLLRDVTDDGRHRAGGWGLKDASKKKKKSDGDAYYKQIVDSMPQLVWTTSVKGSHTYFNQQWYAYTNLEPEQSLGVGWQNPFHEDDMPAALAQWTHSLETGDTYSVEYRCRRGDGVWRWMLGRALPLRDADGEIQSWFGTCTDVDEFVNIRTELSKTQEQFKATLEGADVIILAIDASWHCTFFQGSHRDAIIKDIPDSIIEGKSIKELWPDWPLYEKCEIVMEGKASREQLEWTPARAKDQNAFYRCLITPLTEKLPDGTLKITGCIIVATDVTDMRITQEQLRESYEERAKLLASETAAIEASRLKTEFVANTSHGESPVAWRNRCQWITVLIFTVANTEIRTPVAGIIGLAELLLDDPTLPEQHRSSVAKIMRSGEILLEMIGMVLDMGKVEAGRLDLEHRPFRIDEILNDARMFSTSAEKKGLAFKEQIGPYYHGTVLGDMPRLRQVLANVLSNAIKFTNKGRITMHLKQEHETESHVQIRIEVQDTGVGIKKDAVPLLFKPFHQADASTARQFGGTGLGLCIAKNLLALMGGTIDLSSEFGVGTKMTVVVPLEKAPDGTTEDATPLAEQGADLVRENVWILVTDDNELNREIITKTLTKMGFNVESASNGLDAIEAVQRRQFDIILMDGQMDTMDGYEATQRIRQMSDPKLNRIKIIALTASAIQGDEERCLRAGMNGYLAKPVRARVLEATILKHLARPPPPPPPTLSRRTSNSTTPGAETAQLMSFDFPDTIPEATSTSAADTPSVPRRRPSHPSYSIDAVPNSGTPSGPM